jgi:hypothetical protein
MISMQAKSAKKKSGLEWMRKKDVHELDLIQFSICKPLAVGRAYGPGRSQARSPCKPYTRGYTLPDTATPHNSAVSARV